MAAISTLTDTFATHDAGKWSLSDSAVVSVFNGRLLVVCGSGYDRATSVTTYDLTDSGAFVEVPRASLGSAGTGNTIFQIGDDTNGFQIVTDASGPPVIRAERIVSSAVTSQGQANYDPVAHRWWRIVESAGTVTWSVSPDGTTWTTLGTPWVRSGITITALGVNLIAGFYGAENGVATSVFDNFNTIPASRAAVTLTHVGSSAWVAPASGATVTPTYPSSLADGDAVYAYLHIKPNTATVATPTDWALVGSAPGGGGAVGAGTGPTRVHVYVRSATAGLSGSQAFTITGGSSPVAFMRAYRATGNNVSFDEDFTSWTVGTGSTTVGGTARTSLSFAPKDDISIVLGVTDDQPTAGGLAITGITATGITFDALTADPATNIVNAQGNDISAAAARLAVTVGSAAIAPAVTATSSTSETAMGLVMRVRALAEASTTPVRLVRRSCLSALLQM